MPGTADVQVSQTLSVLTELTVAIRGRHVETKKKGIDILGGTVSLQRCKNGVKKGIVGKVALS